MRGQACPKISPSALTRQGVLRPDAPKTSLKIILPFAKICRRPVSLPRLDLGSYHEGIAANDRATLRRAQNVLLAALLFLMNAYVCRGLFGMEYLRHMGSIEAAYIGISRYMLAHWRDFSWFPLWYAGIPAQNTYPPLLHWMVALAALLRGISPAHAHHWVTAIFYCLGPVALFALTLRLSGSRRAAFIAGVLYSVLSPSEWLMPAIGRATGSVPSGAADGAGLRWRGTARHRAHSASARDSLPRSRAGAQARTLFRARRVQLCFGRPDELDWSRGFGARRGRVSCREGKFPANASRATSAFIVFLAVAAYCLASPWIPPSTIAAVQTNSKFIGGDYSHTGAELLRWTPAALLILLVLKLILRGAPRRTSNSPSSSPFSPRLHPLAVTWAKVAIVPQPERYHLEMELALALLAGLLLDAGLRLASLARPGRAVCHRRVAARTDLAGEVVPALRARQSHPEHRYYYHLGMAHRPVAQSALERRTRSAAGLVRVLADCFFRYAGNRTVASIRA